MPESYQALGAPCEDRENPCPYPRAPLCLNIRSLSGSRPPRAHAALQTDLTRSWWAQGYCLQRLPGDSRAEPHLPRGEEGEGKGQSHPAMGTLDSRVTMHPIPSCGEGGRHEGGRWQ